MDPPSIEGYEILSLLGRGGMGAVYRARQLSTGREVALKVMRAAVSDDAEFRLRFKREAAALSNVRHPGITEFLGSGGDGDIVYFVMEYVAGEPLSERIADGALAVREALEIACQVADALAEAHSAGIIHRDIKPSNIILSSAGAKITDFGLARRIKGSGLTTSGRVMGSLPYMSPEQIRGERLTTAADVYSLGVVLFEMLSGKLPFDADSEEALATKILTEPAPILSRTRKDSPIGLDLLLIKMLAKQLDLRPASGREVREKLRELVGGSGVISKGAEGAPAGEGAFSRFVSILCRVALMGLPGGATDGVAGALASWGRARLSAGSASELRLERAVVRRRLRRSRRELAALERKRDLRLERARDAENRIPSADIEQRQHLQRLAKELRMESQLFQERIDVTARRASGDESRLRRLSQMIATLG